MPTGRVQFRAVRLTTGGTAFFPTPGVPLTIKTKLIASFAVVIGLMGVLGLATINRVGSIDEQTSALGQDVVPSTQVIGMLKDKTGAFRRNQLRYITALNAEDREGVVEDLDENTTQIPAELETYRDELISDARDRAGLEAFTAAWTTYVKVTEGVRADVDAGRPTDAINRLNEDEGDKAWDGVKETLASWDELGTKTADRSLKAVDADVAGLRTIIIALLLAGLVAAVVTAALLTRRIVGGLHRLVAAARGIAQGDVDQHIDLGSKDELGQAASPSRRWSTTCSAPPTSSRAWSAIVSAPRCRT